MPTPSKVIDLAPEDKPPAHRANGRPPKPQNYYTPKMTKFMEGIKKLLPLSSAADYAGMQEVQWYRWCDYAAQGREPYVSYVQEVKSLRASQEADILAEIGSAPAGKTGWQHKAWLLERTRPDKYALKQYGTASGAAQLLGSVADILRLVKENTQQPKILDITTTDNVHYDNVNITEAEFKPLPDKPVKHLTKKSRGAP